MERMGPWGTLVAEKIFGDNVPLSAAAGAKPYYRVDPSLYLNAPGDHGEPVSAENGEQVSYSNWYHFTADDGTPMVALRNIEPTTGRLLNYNVFKDPGDFGGSGWSGAKMSKMNGVAFDAIGPDGTYQGSGKFSGWKDDNVGDAKGVASIIAMAAGAAAGGLGGAGAAGAEAGAGATAAGAGAGTAAGAGTGAAELAAGAGLGAGAPLGAEAVSAYGSLAGTASLESVAAAMGMTPEAFSALGAAGTGAAGAAAGQLAGTAAGSQLLSNPGLLSQVASKLGMTSGDLTSILGAGASLIGGGLAANAAGDAADAQLKAQREAAALSEPWRAAGTKALNRMQEVLGIGGDANAQGYGSMNKPFTAESLYADPSYQFRKEEGLKGLSSAYAGKGSFLSGGALRGIDRYGQDYASTEYGKGWDRDAATKTSEFNRLASVAGTGQTAANTMGGYASNAGDAAAAGKVGTANAWTDAINGAFKTWQTNQSNSQMQPYYNALTQRLLAP